MTASVIMRRQPVAVSMALEFRKVLLGLVVGLLMISSGCATKDLVKPPSDEDVVRERVAAYWDQRIKGNLDKTYEFEDPFYRKKVGLVSYIRSFGGAVTWKAVTIRNIEMSDTSAVVDLQITTDVRLPDIKARDVESVATEKWVKVDGVWYHVPGRYKKGDHSKTQE
jgi:hypothetical protein